MRNKTRLVSVLVALAAAVVWVGTFGCAPGETGPRTITVAQSGKADVVGSDNVALQKAAGMLKPGDTLVIGPGVYTMNNGFYVPSGVTVRGTAGKTILKKSDGVESPLKVDAGYGMYQLMPEDPSKFRGGMGVSVLDDDQSGWGVTVTTVTAVEGDILRIDPMTLFDYLVVPNHAKVQNTFPILAVLNAENVLLEGITVDGNKDTNSYLGGCRGGAIYMDQVRNVTVRNCVARNYNGDGISFQITDQVKILDCESFGHTGLGVHPGTGSDRSTVKGCHIHDNGKVGLFLCWRVRHGEFSDNLIENNGNYGISIGHKDTDNLFERNKITHNGLYGVYFRQETFSNSGHRNTFRDNTILDNGSERGGAGFYIEPKAGDIVIENNRISETRAKNPTQLYGVYKVKGAGEVRMENNTIQGNVRGEFAEGKGLK